MTNSFPSSSAPIISASAVTKRFAPDIGVFDLSLEVAAGSILGLIGPSGSGKTTTVRLLTGLIHPDEGQLTVMGTDPTRFGSAERQRVGYLPQESALYPTLSIRENLMFAASMYGLNGRAAHSRVDAVLQMVDLDEAGDRRVADSSGGMKRRTGLAGALVHEPTLVFLDEPTAGVDPILRLSLWKEFEALRDAGTTVVVTTQYVGDAAMCDEVVLLAGGKVAARGTPDGLRRDAFGGELVGVRFEQSVRRADVETIGTRIDAASFRGTGLGEVEFVVPDAGTATAEIHRAADEMDLRIAEIERRIPDLDETFVQIVNRERKNKEVSV
ncbi:MAG: ABC transporter ATP-binding protein [Acidimicrobiia bacterium]